MIEHGRENECQASLHRDDEAATLCPLLHETFAAQEWRAKIQRVVQIYATRPRLLSGRGNGVWMTASLYQALRCQALLREAEPGLYCGIYSHYDPHHASRSDYGTSLAENQAIYNAFVQLLAEEGLDATGYRKRVCQRFCADPPELKLMLVAGEPPAFARRPSCSYLFSEVPLAWEQLKRIAQITRLPARPDKLAGILVSFGGPCIGASHGSWLRARFQAILERMNLTLGTVGADRGAFLRAYCGDPLQSDCLNQTREVRRELRREIAELFRVWVTWAAVAPEQARSISSERLTYYADLRDHLLLAAGEVDPPDDFEQDVRATKCLGLPGPDHRSLVEILASDDTAQWLNNVHHRDKAFMVQMACYALWAFMTQRHEVDPAFYQRMAARLKRAQTRPEDHLTAVVEIAQTVWRGSELTLPGDLQSPGRRSLCHLLLADRETAYYKGETLRENQVATAAASTRAIIHALETGAPDRWRGHTIKRRRVRQLLKTQLHEEPHLLEQVLELVTYHKEF